jgi:hypothetical protein
VDAGRAASYVPPEGSLKLMLERNSSDIVYRRASDAEDFENNYCNIRKLL